jgi:hypothetical protein
VSVFPFGELNAESRADDVSVQFQYPFYNTEFDLNPAVTAGGATATVAAGYLQLTSGVGGSVIVTSKNSIRYRPGHSGYAQFTASFVGAGVGSCGAWSPGNDGFFVRVTNGVPSLGYEKGGVEVLTTAVPRQAGVTLFDGGTIPIELIDFTKINIFRIMFGYLGVANPVFQIKKNGRWYVLGTIDTEGRLTATHINNPVLPIGFRATGAMTIRTASWNGGKLGDSDIVGARFFASNTAETLSTTTLATVGTFRNKTTYKTVANRVKAKLVRYSLFVDAPASGSGTVEIIIRKNAVTAGVPTWVDIDADNSVMEVDTVATYASAGRQIFIAHVGYAAGTGGSADMGGAAEQGALDFGIFLLPGETATVTAQNVAGTQNVTVRVVFNWIELF